VLSGDAERGALLRARDAGTNDFLVKPVSLDTLCAHLRSLLAKRRGFAKSDIYFGPDRRRRAVVTGTWDRRRARVH
jgi:DNA-binding response OmpR family regulator